MRLTLNPSVLALIASVGINTVTAIPGSSLLGIVKCLEIPHVIESFDINRIEAIFDREICSKGGSVSPSEWESTMRDFASYVITEESKNMGAPELSDEYILFADRLVEMAYDQCLDEEDLATDDLCRMDRSKNHLGCLQRNGGGLVLSNAPSILKIVSGDYCRKQVAYFGNPELVETTFPRYLREFVEQYRMD